MPSLFLSLGLDNCLGAAAIRLRGEHSRLSFERPPRRDTRSPRLLAALFSNIICIWSIRWDDLSCASAVVCIARHSGRWFLGHVAIIDLDAERIGAARRYLVK